MLPCWRKQHNRCIVPCNDADTHEWLRAGPVTTLGELFKHLGTDHAAKTFYGFYRTCRLIVLKRKKDAAKSKPQGAPGHASAAGGSSVTGVAGSELQAGAIRSEMLSKWSSTNAKALVEEYIHVKGLPPAYVDAKSPQQLISCGARRPIHVLGKPPA